MRRLDRLIIKSFLGPFFLTTLVATFILLIQYMLKYFDDFVGKNLGAMVFGKLMFYFSLNMLSVALPLGVLVSSLMTFGNLGEKFELTAIKSAGISLTRTLKPIFFFVCILSFGAFHFNNRVVPATNLKAYSLLYDIKHKKPTLDIKPGVFYQGIPNYSIKAGSKLPDNQTLLDVMIYDHNQKNGNLAVILADSSKMYTIYNEKFLKLELYDGISYLENVKKPNEPSDLQQTKFDRLDIVFSLSSFDLKRTKEELFRNNRQMKNIAELTNDIDSLNNRKHESKIGIMRTGTSYMKHHFADLYPEEEADSTENQDTTRLVVAGMFELPEIVTSTAKSFFQDSTNRLLWNAGKNTLPKPANKIKTGNLSLYDMTMEDLDSIFLEDHVKKMAVVQTAIGRARNFKTNMSGVKIRVQNMDHTIYRYTVSKYNKYAQAFACIVMFLIGAPLGAIIKKGGLGVPVIISIFFFITYYVLTMTSEKWAKAGFVDGKYFVWMADIILLPFGLFFLRQARIDARLFDTDFYLVVFDKLKLWLNTKSSS